MPLSSLSCLSACPFKNIIYLNKGIVLWNEDKFIINIVFCFHGSIPTSSHQFDARQQCSLPRAAILARSGYLLLVVYLLGSLGEQQIDRWQYKKGKHGTNNHACNQDDADAVSCFRSWPCN